MMHALALTFDLVLIMVASCNAFLLITVGIAYPHARRYDVDFWIGCLIALAVIGRVVFGVIS